MFFFQWRNKITNLTSGIRLCDVIFLMSLLHIAFTETDAQEMQKCCGFGKFSPALHPCGCKVFSFIFQKSSGFFSLCFNSSLSMLVWFNCSILVNFACLLMLSPGNGKCWSVWSEFLLFTSLHVIEGGLFAHCLWKHASTN